MFQTKHSNSTRVCYKFVRLCIIVVALAVGGLVVHRKRRRNGELVLLRRRRRTLGLCCDRATNAYVTMQTRIRYKYVDQVTRVENFEKAQRRGHGTCIGHQLRVY